MHPLLCVLRTAGERREAFRVDIEKNLRVSWAVDRSKAFWIARSSQLFHLSLCLCVSLPKSKHENWWDGKTVCLKEQQEWRGDDETCVDRMWSWFCEDEWGYGTARYLLSWFIGARETSQKKFGLLGLLSSWIVTFWKDTWREEIKGRE